MLLLTFVLAASLHAKAQEDHEGPASVMRKYLAALKALDQDRLERYWAPEVSVVRGDGTQAILDKGQNRKFREFERATKTKWTYKIVGVNEGEVTVILTEDNDYYRLLDLGKSTSMTVYTVKDGLVSNMQTLGVVFEHGKQGKALEKFRSWLLKQPEGAATPFMRDGHFVYDAQSAPKMIESLRKWRGQERGR